MRWSTERIGSLVLVAAALIIFTIMSLPLFTGSVYVSDDLGRFHLPLRIFYARCLAVGDDPWWCPNLFCGFYLHGEGQVGMTHPVHVLLYRMLPVSVAFNLELLICYPICFFGLYLVLRVHKLPTDAALLGAFVFTFAGYNLLHYRHVNSVEILAHLPWLLLAIRHALIGNQRGNAWGRLAVGLLTASQLAIGYPQIVWYSSLVETMYAVGLVWRSERGLSLLISLLVAKTLGVFGGAIQWLPTLETIRDSQRHDPTWDMVTMGSLHPLYLVGSIAPYFFAAKVNVPQLFGTPQGVDSYLRDWREHECGMYLGACVPVLLAWLALRWRNLATGKPWARAALWVALPALLIALGRYAPLYWLVTRLPLVGYFRMPARYLLLVHLSEALLAAVAFADLRGLVERREAPPGRLALLWFMPLAALAVVLVVPDLIRITLPANILPPVGSTPNLLLGPVLILVATGLIVLSAHGQRWALLAILVFLSVDVGYYGLSYIRRDSIRPIEPFLVQRSLPDGSSRVRVRQVGENENTPIAAGISLEGGYVALIPRRMLPERDPRTLRLRAVGWQSEGSSTNPIWTRMPNPLPKVRLVAISVATSEPGQILDTIDPVTTAMVEPGHEADLAKGPPGTADLVSQRPGSLEIATMAPATRLLVISESYHAGWHTRVNGAPVETLRVNGEFLGCYVPAGAQRVSLQFAPTSLARGRTLSLTGLSLLIGWTVIGLVWPVFRSSHTTPLASQKKSAG